MVKNINFEPFYANCKAQAKPQLNAVVYLSMASMPTNTGTGIMNSKKKTNLSMKDIQSVISGNSGIT